MSKLSLQRAALALAITLAGIQPALARSAVAEGTGAPNKTTMEQKASDLTPAQLKRAKIADHSGRRYDTLRKTWWDGQNWWFGRHVWLFIDDTWYYGNSRWLETDGSWKATDLNEQPVCLGCPMPSAPISAATPRPADLLSTPIKPTAEPQSVTAKVQQLPAPKATARNAPVASSPLPNPAPSQPAPVAITAARACTKFLPELNMTMTVPCAE